MTMKTVFYAWQSQRPNKCNRSLIEEALKRALKELSQDEKDPVEFEIEQDARGVLGSPEISSTILQKIDNCSAFIADVTPVGSLIDGKSTPNPNVLFELGFAWHKMGENRIILVLNDSYGSPEDLPFDISKRCLVRYRFDLDSPDGPGNARTNLTNQFKHLLSAMWHADQVRPLRDSGLSDIDIALFRSVYAKMIEDDSPVCEYEAILKMGQSLVIDEEGVNDAVQMIADAGLWGASAVMGPHRYSHVSSQVMGMERYCEAFLPGYHSLRDEIARKVVEGTNNSKALAKNLDKPEVLVEHVLELFETNDYIRISKNAAGIQVFELKPKLRRLFGSQQ